MAYTLTARNTELPDETPQRWMARVHDISGYPDQAVETEYDDMDRATATAELESLHDQVTADPARFFGAV